MSSKSARSLWYRVPTITPPGSRYVVGELDPEWITVRSDRSQHNSVDRLPLTKYQIRVPAFVSYQDCVVSVASSALSAYDHRRGRN